MSAALVAVMAPRLKALRVALVIAALGALPAPVATADAAEPCPNEQLRQESNVNPATGSPYSTQLPDCRAYELVSPADAGGPVEANTLADVANLVSAANTTWLLGTRVAEDGNLVPQLRAALDVQGNGEAVFWNSRATPPGTGAIEDAAGFDPFRSVRRSNGWITQDLLPSGLQVEKSGSPTEKRFLGASADGSSALILTSLAFDPSAFANPQEAALGESRVANIYRVDADGGPKPQLVTHGDFLLPDNGALESLGAGGHTAAGPFEELSASPDLSEVTFRSTIQLEFNDNCTERDPENQSKATSYLWNANSLSLLAHVIFRLAPTCTSPNFTGVPTILPNGLPILMPNPANPELPAGPLVENQTSAGPESVTQLAGPSGATLLSVTPDSSTAYVLTEGNIHAVSTTTGWEGANVCISCSNGPSGPDGINVTYITTSNDGAHVLFTTDQGLWEWNASSGAQLLTPKSTPITDLGPGKVIVSENGQHVVALTSEALLPAKDTNNGPDLYELGPGQETPTLITSGTSADTYALYINHSSNPNEEAVASGVSNDGQRVVYNDQPPAVGGHQPPQVIDEWEAGQTQESGQIKQLSPAGSSSGYSVQGIAGGQLQDVFFIAYDPLVPQDFNAGQADVYDARTDGGFPFCTPGNPAPPPGVERCGAATSNPNPTVPSTPGYPANLAPPRFQLPSLPADTSVSTSSAAKPSTRAQKLAKALKACKKDKSQSKRKTCEKEARKKYGTQSKKSASKKGAS